MLRPYQKEAIDKITQGFRRGVKKVLLYSATGSGKTVMFCEILKRIHLKGSHGIVLVRGRKLVDQASQRLARENVPHGVFMSGHWRWKPSEKIQVASIDTVRARGLRPKADICVIDEAHMAVSDSFKDFLNDYPDAYVVGVTASPFSDKSLEHVASEIIHTVSIAKLIEDGFLVDGKYYAPKIPDLSNVKISSTTKDYVIEDLENVFNSSALVGDAVTEWKKLGENRSTLVFCVSVAHSKAVCEAFNNQGISSMHIDANVKDAERDSIIKKLEDGVIKVLCSVGTMITGVDIPSLGCILFLRPTKSYILWVQMIGRGTRIFPGKKNFLVLDHSGNLMRHGTLRDIDSVEPSLVGKKVLPKISVMQCAECFAVYPSAPGPCPMCGYLKKVEEKVRKLEVIDGELAEFINDPQRRRFEELQRIQKKKGLKRGWIWYTLKDEFGEEVANQFMPRREIPVWLRRK